VAELLENGGLLRISIDRILSRAVMEQIERDLAAHEQDRHLKLVVIQGAGGHFSYGASVEEHRRHAAPLMLRGLSRLVRSIAHFPAPVAAFVEGRCLGGGFELALACQLIFVTPTAQLGCPEIRLGVFPPVLAAIGPSKIGGALTDRLVLTGDTISGADARPWASIVSGFGDVLDWYRRSLAPDSAAALRIATRAIRRDDARIDELEKLYLDEVLASHDGNEGIEAFIARRAPAWEDA
jgi:cyclohexa-1,5-dienecarbonyl-CoA hydratase